MNRGLATDDLRVWAKDKSGSFRAWLVVSTDDRRLFVLCDR